jgi:HSP20 family protein
MDFLLGGTTGPVHAGYPPLNVWSGEEGAVVTAEIPGVDPNDIDITVVGETLTVKGDRKREGFPEGTKYHRRERAYGDFSRTIQLPFQVDQEKVEAKFKNGILSIELPRFPEEEPKKIDIKSAQ